MSAIIPSLQRSAVSELPGFRPGPIRPSKGVGPDADSIAAFLNDIETHQSRETLSVKSVLLKRRGAVAISLAERLYDALADAKLLTAQVAMHFDQDWRTRLFAQLDDLLDVEEWHEDDEPIKGASFRTFLRMTIYQSPERRPGLGVSHRGNLIAAWTSGADRLTLEFSPGDMIRWVLSCEIDGELERAAGETPVRRFPEVVSAFRPERWFSDAQRQNST